MKQDTEVVVVPICGADHSSSIEAPPAAPHKQPSAKRKLVQQPHASAPEDQSQHVLLVRREPAGPDASPASSLQQENKRLRVALHQAHSRLDYISQRCCGCEATLVDSERLWTACCNRPVCVDCQGVWVHDAIKIKPTKGIEEVDSVALAFDLCEVTCEPKTLCCFKDYTSGVDAQQQGNPAKVLFTAHRRHIPAAGSSSEDHTNDDQSAPSASSSSVTRCEACKQRREAPAPGQLQHGLLDCAESNVFRCPLCHIAGSLTGVDTKHDDMHWDSYRRALLQHTSRTCASTPICSRCGSSSGSVHSGQHSRHALPLHFNEDLALGSLARQLGQLQHLSDVVALPTTPSAGQSVSSPLEQLQVQAQYLMDDVIDNFSLVFLNVLGEELIGNASYHQAAVHRQLYTLAVVLKDVRLLLRDALANAASTVMQANAASTVMHAAPSQGAQALLATVIVPPAMSSPSSADTTDTYLTLKHAVEEAEERLRVDFVHVFAREVLGKAVFHEGARFMPASLERQYAGQASASEFPATAWHQSPYAAVGWIFARTLITFAALNRHRVVQRAQPAPVETAGAMRTSTASNSSTSLFAQRRTAYVSMLLLVDVLPEAVHVLSEHCGKVFGGRLMATVIKMLAARGYVHLARRSCSTTVPAPAPGRSSSSSAARSTRLTHMPLQDECKRAVQDRSLLLLLLNGRGSEEEEEEDGREEEAERQEAKELLLHMGGLGSEGDERQEAKQEQAGAVAVGVVTTAPAAAAPMMMAPPDVMVVVVSHGDRDIIDLQVATTTGRLLRAMVNASHD